MALTLGTTGMDTATEAALRSAFESAAAGSGWRLVPENEADYVVVDMDSMYGPMSWLRLHAAGKQVIGLTAAIRTQTDYRLGSPVDAAELAALLAGIAGDGGGVAAPAGEGSGHPAQSDQAGTPIAAAPRVAQPTAPAAPAAPAAADAPRDEAPAPPVTAPEPTPAAVDTPSSAPAATAAAAEPAPPPAPEPTPAPEPPPAPEPAPAAPRGLLDWLKPGALASRSRFQRGDGPSLLLDPEARQYHGPATLKAVAACFEGEVGNDDFEPLDAAAWASASAALGAAQPMARLQWFGGLLAGKGHLLPGYDASGRFRLGKWPQTEREFPKHFRIATAMMKGPATLEEIAAASSVPLDEVTDFVNANLVTGYAEPFREPEPEPEATKSGGLLGRLRGR